MQALNRLHNGRTRAWLAVIQKKVKTVGTSNTPSTNSRTVRPREMRAMNMPTNGDHEIHQPQ